MRTESDLRSAFTAITDGPHDTDAVFRSIVGATRRRRVRRIRSFALIAVVTALIVVAAVVVPDLLVKRTVVPADQRVPGNWNLTHAVEPLPAGWTVRHVLIARDSEALNVGPITESSADQANGCDVRVFVAGAGAPPAGAPQTPIEVNGRPGVYVDDSDPSHLPGAYWRHTDDAWAYAGCATRGASLDIAGRVRPAVTPTTLPFRFDDLPAGYRVGYVAPPREGPADALIGGVQLVTDETTADRPDIGVSLQAGQTTIPAGIAGWETTSIDGVPAVLSARDGRLCLNPAGYTLCLDSGEGAPADLAVSLWPAGRRELLVELAGSLTLVPDPGDRSSYFDANATLPR